MRTLLLNIRNRTKSHFDNIHFYTRTLRRTDTSGRKESCDMEVGKNPRGNTGKKLGAVAMTILSRFLTLLGRFIFKFVYGEKGEAMPAINDLTLTESATSLATKIRLQKVRGWESPSTV